jgi:ABC-type Mn2+/Zn2+ transport system ATPase subunit
VSLFDATVARPMVAARDLVLAYGAHQILGDVSLRIMPGETWFVIGPNGAGKSTLLKALLGLLRPRAGSLALMRELDDRQRLGFVPQRLELPTTVPTTVREFVSLGFTGLACGRKERQGRLATALDQVGLKAQAMEALEHLSGGQRQRASIARALVREPLLLLVDEPTTGLDLVAAQDLMALLTTLTRERSLTTVFVAHDLALVSRHASHVALVAAGTVTVGTADDILTPARLSAAFGVPITRDGRLAVAGTGSGESP